MIFLLLICISAVSATDNSTANVEKIVSTDTTSTETNYEQNTATTTEETITKTNATQNTKESTTTANTLKTVYVSTTGNDSNSGTINSPKATLKNAFNTVTNGGTIYLNSGTYVAYGILLNKNVSIIGNSTKSTVINSKQKHTFTVTANVTLKAFTIMNAHDKANGGAIYNKGTLRMEGIKIQSSTAALKGGAIYNKGVLIVTKSTFTKNYAPNGGVIYNTGSMSLTRCTFATNKAKQGGVIYTTGKMSLNGCNFTNNCNTSIYIYKSKESTIKSCSFISNTGSNGGAIDNRQSLLTLYKTYFEKNSATNYGGAVYSTGKLNITSCTFTTNSAKRGGAIYTTNTLTMTDSSIKNNKATDYGGAIFSRFTATITNTKFNANTAKYGGAIASQGSGVITMLIDRSQFTNNVANTGGAILVYNYTILNLRNSALNANKNSAIYIKTSTKNNQIYNTSLTKNTGTYGGAVLNYYSQLTMKKCYVSGNNASYGGAVFNKQGNVSITYTILLNNGKNDVYNNPGVFTANYNWWGYNTIATSRLHKVTVNNWLYMTLTNTNVGTVNSTVTTTVSLYNAYNGKSVTTLSARNELYNIPLNVNVNGCGVSKTLTLTDSGYYTLTSKFTQAGTATVTAQISSQQLKETLTFKEKTTTNKITSLFVQIGASVTSSDVSKWVNAGITDVYVQTFAAENNTSKLRSVIQLCKNTNIRVHAWIVCLKNDNGFDISTARQTVVKNFIKSTIRIDGISGVCLDYIRYSGTKANVDSTVVTNFVKAVHSIVKGYNKNLIVSACVFAEKAATKTYYGQDYAALSPYVDVMLPMTYKYAYSADRAWLKSATQYVVDRATSSKVVSVLQTYQTDAGTGLLSASELELDAKAVMSAGSAGYSLFRFGLISSYPSGASKL